MSDTSWLIDRVIDKLRTPGLEADEVKAILLQYEKSKEWAKILDGCNFSMARDDIRAALEMQDREAAEKGGTHYYNPDFITALEKLQLKLMFRDGHRTLRNLTILYAYVRDEQPP